ncbi:MAG: hypothetical protein PHU53_04865 [Thermoplasmata archaeon]|nr:hypothetical protein [Thermoplasmata archaeon]
METADHSAGITPKERKTVNTGIVPGVRERDIIGPRFTIKA